MFEQQNNQLRQTGSRWRTALVVFAAVFAVSMAVLIGERLSNEALAVLAGAICGVGAAIPTSLLIVYVSRRREEQRVTTTTAGVYPPVVVIAPPGVQNGFTSPAERGMTYQPGWPVQRQFTIVGGDSVSGVRDWGM